MRYEDQTTHERNESIRGNRTSNHIGRNQQVYGQDDDEDDGAVPATPDERMKNVLQLQEIQRATRPDGRTRFPVKELAMAENSQQFRLTIDHPFEDKIRFFLKKPRTWDSDQELVRFLDFYDYRPSNIYELQTGAVYLVENDVTVPSSHVISADQKEEWRLVAPPDTPVSKRERAAKWVYERIETGDDMATKYVIAMLAASASAGVGAALAFPLAEGKIAPEEALLLFILGLSFFALVFFGSVVLGEEVID